MQGVSIFGLSIAHVHHLFLKMTSGDKYYYICFSEEGIDPDLPENITSECRAGPKSTMLPYIVFCLKGWL